MRGALGDDARSKASAPIVLLDELIRQPTARARVDIAGRLVRIRVFREGDWQSAGLWRAHRVACLGKQFGDECRYE